MRKLKRLGCAMLAALCLLGGALAESVETEPAPAPDVVRRRIVVELQRERPVRCGRGRFAESGRRPLPRRRIHGPVGRFFRVNPGRFRRKQPGRPVGHFPGHPRGR